MDLIRNLEEFRKVGFPLLYIGPEGIGKWDRLASFAKELGDPMLLSEPSMDDAREVALRYAQKPLFGSLRVVTALDLSNASEAIQSALLKPLEDPGGWKAILLCSSQRLLRTVESRCHVVRARPLDDDQVRDRLLAQGHSAVMVSTLSSFCGGSPGRVDYLMRLWPKRSRAVSLIQALARRDRMAMVDLARSWDADDWLATRRWCLEVISDWPQCFTQPELDMSNRMGKPMVYELVQYADDRASLEDVVLRLWKK